MHFKISKLLYEGHSYLFYPSVPDLIL